MTKFDENLLILFDSYKVGHWRQFEEGCTGTQYYFEARAGEDIVFFGLSYILQKYLSGIVVTLEKIDEAREFWNLHMGRPDLFNEAGWKHILQDHFGKLPVDIRSVPEGTVSNSRTVLFTVESTCPQCFWVPGVLETLLVQVWHGCTVATISREFKKKILRGLEVSGDPKLIDYKLHDFGMRGASSVESAAIGGAAHLLNFSGTDTVSGIRLADSYYNSGICGHSIDALEHSTKTIYGPDRELTSCRKRLENNPSGMFADVSDSYDLEYCVKYLWGTNLREEVLARSGTLVIRPDSGYPPDIVVKVLSWLESAFGSTVNSKGFKVLHPNVRVIQGDGINIESVDEIINSVIRADYSLDNVAFGSGMGIHTYGNRDTYRFAMKMCWAKVNGVERNVFKMPKTDTSKGSKAGRQQAPCLVFSSGECFNWDFAAMRNRAAL